MDREIQKQGVFFWDNFHDFHKAGNTAIGVGNFSHQPWEI